MDIGSSSEDRGIQDEEYKIGIAWLLFQASVAKSKHRACFAQWHGVRTAGSVNPLLIVCSGVWHDVVKVVLAIRSSWRRHRVFAQVSGDAAQLISAQAMKPRTLQPISSLCRQPLTKP